MNPTQDGFIVSVTNPSPATNISATSVTATTGSFTSLSTSSLALGSINSTPIGNTVPSTGAFTTLSSTLSSITLGSYTLTVTQSGTLGTMAFQGVPAAGLVYSTGSGVIPATIGSGLTLAAGGTLSSTSSGGTVTSVTASGGTTGLSFSGSPITTAGTLTLAGTLGIGAGGTGTSTAFTTGSVVFAGASGVYSQNNSQLFWDNTNGRLGIRTTSPAGELQVVGVGRFGAGPSDATNATLAFYSDGTGISIEAFQGNNSASKRNMWLAAYGGNVGIGTNAPAAPLDVWTLGGTATVVRWAQSGVTNYDWRIPASVDAFALYYGGSTERMRINSSGQVGIGTNSPSYLLDVNGTAHASTITLGTAGTSTGSVILSGVTSGTFTLSASAAAGTGYGFAHAGGSATQSNTALLATSGDTNTAVVLTPKGTGAVIAGPAPDGTATGGNARGANATDLQTSRTASTQVASNTSSVLAGGAQNTSSSQYGFSGGGLNNNNNGAGYDIIVGGQGNSGGGSGWNVIVGGNGNSTGSQYSFIGGGASNSHSGFYGVIAGGANNSISGSFGTVPGGYYATNNGRYGWFGFASGRFSVTGDAQNSISVLRAATTATSAATLTADGAAAGAANIVNLVNNSAMRLTIDIVGRDTTNGNTGGWKLEAIMKRGANAAATALVGTVTSTVVALDAGWASQTTPTLTADTTNGGLNLSVTPITTNSCHWVARVLAVEVL